MGLRRVLASIIGVQARVPFLGSGRRGAGRRRHQQDRVGGCRTLTLPHDEGRGAGRARKGRFLGELAERADLTPLSSL